MECVTLREGSEPGWENESFSPVLPDASHQIMEGNIFCGNNSEDTRHYHTLHPVKMTPEISQLNFGSRDSRRVVPFLAGDSFRSADLTRDLNRPDPDLWSETLLTSTSTKSAHITID